MHTIYALKSHNNGLWYIGVTTDIYHRVASHRSRRPELYSRGHTLKVLGTCATLADAIDQEAQAILKYKTLWPNGNNRCKGGARGSLAAKARKHDIKLLQPVREQFHGDAIAASRIKKLGEDVSEFTNQERRRKAWKRKDKGLPPVPGTEYLLDRRPIRRGTWERTEDWKIKLKAGLARFHERRIAAGQKAHGKGGMCRPFTEAEKFAASAGKLKKRLTHGIPLQFKGVVKAKKTTLARAQIGLGVVPGTEIFLTLGSPLGGSPRESKARSEQLRQEWVDHVNRWQAQYARDKGWT